MSDQAPDIIGSVRGYRYWRLSNGYLTAITHGYIWYDGLNYAKRCGLHSREFWFTDHIGPPELHGCRCGFYSKFQPFIPPERELPFGVVENEGDICLHDTGMRAERARIAALCHSDLYTREVLRKSYPHARIYDSAKEMWRDFPQTDEICEVPTGKYKTPRDPDPWKTFIRRAPLFLLPTFGVAILNMLTDRPMALFWAGIVGIIVGIEVALLLGIILWANR